MHLNHKFDFDTKMNCCTTTIPPEHLQVMRDQFENLTAIMKERGVVTEDEYDEAGIMDVSVSTGTKKRKHDKCLHQNRALMLNSTTNIEKFNAKAREALITPTERQAMKQAKRQLQKDEKIEAKREVKEAKEAPAGDNRMVLKRPKQPTL